MAETRGGNGGSEVGFGNRIASGGTGILGEAGSAGASSSSFSGGGGGGGAGSGVGGIGGTGSSGIPGSGGIGGLPNGADGGASSNGGIGSNLSSGGGGQGGAHGEVGSSISVTAQGGNGGNGGAAVSGGGGGGGAGGYGYVMIGSGTATVSTSVTGGRGGNGGAASNGGEGGGGGGGIIVRDLNASLIIQSTIRGGNGGTGGASTGSVLEQSDGRGGAGGDGVRGTNLTIINSGSVAGGNGGAGASGRPNGDGGSGVAGSSVSVEMLTGGSISGGLSGDGVTRGLALEFTAGTNALTLINGTAALTGGISVSGSLDLRHSGTGATIANVISGSGSVSKSGTGTVTLSGTNTYTGATFVQLGTLALNGGSAIGDSSAVTVANAGSLDVNTNETVGSLAASGTVTLDANLTTGGNNNSTTVSGVISGSGGLTKVGSGTMTLSGINTYSGATTVSGGTLVVNGSIDGSAVTVQSGATLGGSGTVGALTVQSGGAVGPGNSPGILDTGNFALNSGSTLRMELGGTTPGSQHDMVNVAGTVTLGGNLAVFLTAFAPNAGQSFVIINNDGTDAVVGTFAGLAQNATVTVGGELFRISYTGGTGNDVVLTNFDPDTTPPDTIIDTGPASFTNSSTASFTFHGDDGAGSGIAGYQISIDGGAFTTTTSPQSYIGLADGQHTILVRAIDNAGNVDATPDSHTWTVDTVAPVVTFGSTPPANTNSSSFGFSFGANEAVNSTTATLSQAGVGILIGPISASSPVSGSVAGAGTYTLTITTTDLAGNVGTASYTWTVVPNTAPTQNNNAGSTVAEGGADTITSAELDFNDAEQADSEITYTVTSAPTNGTLYKNGVALSVNGTFTQADINNNVITYTHNGSETTSASFGFGVSDGQGGTVSGQTFNFTVNPVNDAPTLVTAAGETDFTQVAGVTSTPVVIDAGVTVADVDSATLASATVAITKNFHAGEDVLAFTNDGATMGNIVATYDASTGVMTLTSAGATATPAQWQAALASVTYLDTARLPDTNPRTISFSVDDGSATSTVATKTIELTDDLSNQAPYKVGTEFLVPTENAGQQLSPSVAALANGGYVVVWSDGSGQGGDASSSGIKAQLFDATGAKVGSEFLVNTETAGSQGIPSVVGLKNGGFIVTFQDRGGGTGDSSQDGVSAQIFDATGAKVGSEFLVNTQTNGNQGVPKITELTNGNFVITWSDTNGTPNGDIKAQVYQSNGVKVGTEILVNTITTGGQNQPSITALANGGFIVVWEDQSGTLDGSSSGIGAQRFDASGNKVGGEFQVNSTTNNLQQRPVITTLTNGNVVVAWYDLGNFGQSNDIVAQILDPNGNKIGSEILVNTVTNGAQDTPAITALTNGGFAIGWKEYTALGGDPSGSVQAQVFDAAGTKVGSQFLVNTVTASTQDTASLAGLKNGNFVIAWKSGSLGSEDVKAQVFGLEAPPVVAPSSGTTAASEQIAAAVDDGLVITDDDNATLASASVAITGGFVAGQDVLSFTNDGLNMGNITAAYDASTGVLTLTSSGATATVAQWQAALRAVSYTNSSDTPDTGNRTISFTVNDGLLDSVTSIRTVSVAALADAPSGADNTIQINEDDIYAFSASDFGFDDVEGGTFTSVIITTLPASGGTLYLFDGFDYVEVAAGQVIDVADIDNGNLVFEPDKDVNGTGLGGFTFQVQDDGSTVSSENTDQSPNTIAFDIDPVNDAPRIFLQPALDVVGAEPDSDGVAIASGDGNGLLFPSGGEFTGLGSAPRHVVLADFNRDGYLDIATANSADDTVTILLGDGCGCFHEAAGSPITVGDAPGGMAVGFFNSDLIPDLVVANTNTRTVTVLLGVGDGTFTTNTILTYPNAGSLILDVAVGDFNNDGDVDLISVGNGSTDPIALALGDGLGGFSPYATMSYPGSREFVDVKTALINGDSYADFVAVDRLNDVAWIGYGGGINGLASFQPLPTGDAPESVALGDVNGDGRLDIVVANGGDDTIGVFVNLGGGNFSTQVTYAVGDGPSSVALADMDEDGNLDIVAGHADGSYHVMLGKGDGTFTPDPDPLFSFYPVTEIAIGNVDPDAEDLYPLVQPFTEGQVLTLAPRLVLSDIDSTQISGAFAVITDGLADDVLAAVTTGTNITATYDAGTFTLMLTGNDTVANYQSVLRSITFASGDDPTDGDTDFGRIIVLAVTDVDGATSFPAPVFVDVKPDNDAPAIAVPPSIAVVEDQTTAVKGISFSDIDALDGEVAVSFSVAAGEGTLAAATVSGSGVTVVGSGVGAAIALVGSIADINAYIAAGHFTYTTAPNANGSVTLGIAISDEGHTGGAAELATGGVTLDITPVNDAPVLTGDRTATVLEGGTYTLVAADLNFSDVDDVASGITFTVSAITNGTVLVNGIAATTFSGTQLAAGQVAFRHDGSDTTAASFNVSVEDGNEDGSTPTARPFTFAVTPVNDAPTLVVNNVKTSIAENASTAGRIKIADLSIVDDNGGTNILRLSGPHRSLFEIVGSALYLKAGTKLDFETKKGYDVTVELDDPTINGNAAEASRALHLAVTDVNEAPTVALTKTTTKLAENVSTSSARTVATIVITDDALGSEKLSLSGADAKLFQIKGSSLQLKAGAKLDFETNPVLDVTVNVDDPTIGNGVDAKASLVIKITDALEIINGSARSNTINGGNNGEAIDGRGGNDTIRGNGGNDVITGGAGVDKLTGGAGGDTFVFKALSDSGSGYSGHINNAGFSHLSGQGRRDMITDFTPGTDKIDLSAIDANTKGRGDQAFHFLGEKAFSGAAGDLVYKTFNFSGTANDKTIIYADVDGNKLADLQIELTGLKVLTGGDFVL